MDGAQRKQSEVLDLTEEAAAEVRSMRPRVSVLLLTYADARNVYGAFKHALRSEQSLDVRHLGHTDRRRRRRRNQAYMKAPHRKSCARM